MNTTNYIRIFRGDDSDALGYQTIVGTIKTDLDLTGCKAVFRFLGFYAEFNPIPEDKKLTIVIPAQASRGFPPGVGYASLKVFDSFGKIRTFTNRIPVIVDTMTPSCGCGEFEVSFSPFPELEPLKIFIGPNADDFDQYTGFVSKIIDRASLVEYGLVVLADAMSEDSGANGKAASPLAVKAAYDAIIKELTDNYYDAEQTEEAIDRVAAYYITYDAAGNPFPTYASLANAQTVYSGGKVRVPTRNDYCVVLADETHDGAEYRYIYAVADGETTGSWQPQFPVEGVMTVAQSVVKDAQDPVSGGGIWSAIWGALSALPTGFASLYDWCVSQLDGKLDKGGGTMIGGLTVPNLTVGSRYTGSTVGTNSVAEGYHTTASGAYSHAEGYYTTASGAYSHAEGGNTTASAANSHAEGFGTTTQNECEHAQGRYNVTHKASNTFGNAGNTLSSIGCSTSNLSSKRKNAVETMQDGKTFIYGLGGYDGTNPTGAGVKDLATAVNDRANRAPNPTAGNLAALDASGNPTDSTISAANVALKGETPYNLGTPTVIDTASSETVEGETVNYGAATLANRTANIVQVTAATALDELRITFPAATNGKVRDFGLRVEIGTGSAALTAPALVPITPTGETIKIENNAAEIPALADGTATAKGVTLLYFSENAPGVFVVKGEQVEEVA